MNMGDILVKADAVPSDLKIYANARHSPTYGRWKHRVLLERPFPLGIV